jgi:hypothetical protein
MVRSTFDRSFWIILVFDGLAHPHLCYRNGCVKPASSLHLFMVNAYGAPELFKMPSHEEARGSGAKTSHMLKLFTRLGNECSNLFRRRFASTGRNEGVL